MKHINPKKVLQNYKNIPINQEFLLNFRDELSSYIDNRPLSTQPVFWQLHRTAVALGLLVIFFTLAGGSLTYASLGSLPGGKLYPLKLASEKLELALVFNKQQKQKLNNTFIARRMTEAASLEHSAPNTKAMEESIAAINNTLRELPEIESREPALISSSSTTPKPEVSSPAPALLSSNEPEIEKPKNKNNKLFSTSTSEEKINKSQELEKINKVKRVQATSTTEKDGPKIKSDKYNLIETRDRLLNILSHTNEFPSANTTNQDKESKDMKPARDNNTSSNKTEKHFDQPQTDFSTSTPDSNIHTKKIRTSHND